MVQAISHQTGSVCHVSGVEEKQESVVIGESDGFHRLLKVTVLGIHGTNVKLGFEVDPDIPIHRSEVWEPIRTHSQVASQTVGPAVPLR